MFGLCLINFFSNRLFLRCAIWDDQYFLIVSESSFPVLNTLNKIEVKRLYPHKIWTEKSLKMCYSNFPPFIVILQVPEMNWDDLQFHHQYEILSILYSSPRPFKLDFTTLQLVRNKIF